MVEEPCLPGGGVGPGYGAASEAESTPGPHELSDFIDEQGWQPQHWVIICVVASLKCYIASSVTSLPFLLGEIQKEFEVGRTAVAAVAASLLVGGIFGTFLGGVGSDAFGRRNLLLVAVVLGVLFSFGHLVVVELWHLLIVRSMIGMSFGAIVAVANVYLVEFMPTNSRGFGILMAGMGWKVGSVFGFVMPWLFQRQWRLVLAGPVVPGILAMILFALCAPESPRWLLTQGKTEQGRAVLQRLFGLSSPPSVSCRGYEKVSHVADCSSGLKRVRLLFAPPTWFVTVTVITLWFFNVSASYSWGLWGPEILMMLLQTESMPYHVFIIAEIMGVFVSLGFAFVLDRLPRRPLLTAACAAVSAMSALIVILPPLKVVILTLFIAMGLPWELIWVTKIVYTKEAFATELRGTATGLVTFAGRVGGAIVPIFVGWRLDASVSGAVLPIAGLMMAGAVAAFFIPVETCQKKLKDIV